VQTTRRPIAALLLWTTWIAVAATAAPRLVTPTSYMQQDRHRSVVARVVELLEEGRFRIEVIEPLRGDTPDGLVLHPGGGLGGEVEVGGVYILGHTDKPPRRTHRWQTDPEGPGLLNVPAVGAAVLENSSAMRTLLRSHPEDRPLSDRARLDAVLEQLASPHVQSRKFVLAELALDAELRELVGESDLKVLQKTLESGSLEPTAHEYLLRAARPMIDTWGADWLANDSRKVVAAHGSELDLLSTIPSLLVTSLGILGETGTAGDAELTFAHLRSNNPGVGKAAFSALLALSPERAEEVAESLVRDESLHGDVRRFVATEIARAETPSAE
jgi:hypothetical protein